MKKRQIAASRQTEAQFDVETRSDTVESRIDKRVATGMYNEILSAVAKKRRMRGTQRLRHLQDGARSVLHVEDDVKGGRFFPVRIEV